MEIFFTFISGLVAVLFFGASIWSIIREVKSSSDKSYTDQVQKWDPYAEIVSMQSESVIYTKNNAKLKTRVTFSDGYIFETHDTQRKDGFISYTIYLDSAEKEQILRSAILTHNAEVLKHTGKRAPSDFIPIFRPTNSPAVPKSKVFTTDGWICKSCGQQNLKNITCCQVCGATKQWSDSQR